MPACRKYSNRKLYGTMRCWVMIIACLLPGLVLADGTEVLGEALIPIEAGTRVVAAGTGAETPPGSIELEIPAGAAIRQVLLYWAGEYSVADDNTLTVNGVEIQGDLIGGPAFFYWAHGETFHSTAYRADITGMGLVGAGVNTLIIDGLNYDSTPHDWGNYGAGIMAILDEGGDPALIEVKDGIDLAYCGFPESEQRHGILPVPYLFEPVGEERNAELAMFFGGVQDVNRPNLVHITVGDQTTTLVNPLNAHDGLVWDTLQVPIVIPAGVDTVLVEPRSAREDGSCASPDGEPLPESLAFIASTLSVEPATVDEDPEECGPCDGGVTELTLRYNGCRRRPRIGVYQRNGCRYKKVFCGRVRSGETFTITGQDEEGTLGNEILIFRNFRLKAIIRTDCSKPIGPGLKRNQFEVLDGTSLHGGPLCPVEEPQKKCRKPWWRRR